MTDKPSEWANKNVGYETTPPITFFNGRCPAEGQEVSFPRLAPPRRDPFLSRLEAEVTTLKAERIERDGILYREGRESAAVEIAALLDAARKEALEEAARWVDAIHEGKDGSRDPAVVDNTCSRIKHAIRALIDKPSAPPSDG